MPQSERSYRLLVTDASAALPVGLWSGVMLLDAVLWSRWLSGAMTVPLSAPMAWASSGAVTAAAVASLILLRKSHSPEASPRSWLPEGITLTLPLLWCWVVSSGASPFVLGGLFALWGMLIVAVGLVHVWVPGEQVACEVANVGAIGKESQKTDDGQIFSHWQKRIAHPEGDVIEGGGRVDFAAGQKEVLVHLAFCPPLSTVPVIHGEDALGGELEVRAEAVHTFGARLSVRRLAGIAAAETRVIAYSAVPPGEYAAA